MYLHSNMVRFIIHVRTYRLLRLFHIYIPIWLDLLSSPPDAFGEVPSHLHSNMVRFIMFFSAIAISFSAVFTFQYG